MKALIFFLVVTGCAIEPCDPGQKKIMNASCVPDTPPNSAGASSAGSSSAGSSGAGASSGGAGGEGGDDNAGGSADPG